MHQIPHFFEARPFGSPLRSSDCSDFLFSTSKGNYTTDYQECGLFDNGELAMTLDPSRFPCLRLEAPTHFESESQYYNHNAPQFNGSSNLIEATNNMQEELCEKITWELGARQNRDNHESMVDGFINLVDQISSFYINKLKDGKPFEEHHLQDQKQKEEPSPADLSSPGEKAFEIKRNETLLRKTIKKMPKKEWTSEDDEKLVTLAKQLDFDWENIRKKFKKIANVDRKFLQNRYHAITTKKKTSKQAFSKEEDLQIVKYHQIYKGNWDQISKFIPNRKAYLIKKRFYSHIRKNLSQLSKELSSQTEKKGSENQGEILHTEKEYSTDLTTDSRVLSDAEENFLEREDDEKQNKQRYESKLEAIEVLSSRISLLQSLYNQTKVELTELQKDHF